MFNIYDVDTDISHRSSVLACSSLTTSLKTSTSVSVLSYTMCAEIPNDSKCLIEHLIRVRRSVRRRVRGRSRRTRRRRRRRRRGHSRER